MDSLLLDWSTLTPLFARRCTLLAAIKINIKVHYKAIFRSCFSHLRFPICLLEILFRFLDISPDSSCEISLLRPSTCQAAKKRNDMLDDDIAVESVRRTDQNES
ncbi:unnamed protein product, partial [Mesorhabditis belari]|uniref:Uncharacterized protein n=1 Tax=Mesorhabditis belari TaxID=2138241 RepID=A0AAF3EXU7_9BILA